MPTSRNTTTLVKKSRKKTKVVKRNTAGRPLKYGTVGQIKELIDAYFAECDPHYVMVEHWEHPMKKVKRGKLEVEVPDYEAEEVMVMRRELTQQRPYTVTGLAMALGSTRDTLMEYSGRPAFADTIKAAKLKCHNYTENYLYEGKNTAGAIFSLKNNYGWRDEVQLAGTIEFPQLVQAKKLDYGFGA